MNGSSHTTPSLDCSVAAFGGVPALCPKISIIKADTAYVWHWLGTCTVFEACGISERKERGTTAF